MKVATSFVCPRPLYESYQVRWRANSVEGHTSRARRLVGLMYAGATAARTRAIRRAATHAATPATIHGIKLSAVISALHSLPAVLKSRYVCYTATL